MKTRWLGVIILAILLACRVAPGLETDQFTVPPRPLVDLGPRLDAHLLKRVRAVADAANARHGKLVYHGTHAPLGVLRKFFNDRATETLSADYIAGRVFEEIGPGLPECAIEQWTLDLARSRPGWVFEPALDETVYGTIFQRPLTLQTISPTVNLYGVYLGTDKVGHLFQQGYEYYRVYRAEEDRGHSAAEAAHAAVELGISQEKGFYGEAMVGVYSNGDLAGNFAGLQFYLNLTRPMTIRDRVRPPILVLVDDRWQMNAALEPDVLKIFISEHLNEARNASRYAWYIRDHVKAAARARGPAWAAFYGADRSTEAKRALELWTWFGQDYGHSGFRNVFTAAEVCCGERE